MTIKGETRFDHPQEMNCLQQQQQQQQQVYFKLNIAYKACNLCPQLAVLFKNTRILKFISQLTFMFNFAAVNHPSGPLREQKFTYN